MQDQIYRKYLTQPFDNFFGILKKGNFTGFKSKLDVELEKE